MTQAETEYVDPPRSVNDPRPPIHTMLKWPVALAGTAMVALLAGITIGPTLFRDEPEPKRVDPEPRMATPRPLHGMPTDYSQVQPPPEPEAVPAPAPAPAPVAAPAPAPVTRVMGGGPRGPTKTELLREAMRSPLKPIPITSGGNVAVEQAAVGGSGGAAPASNLYSRHSLVDPYECQVNAGTNIPAMTEQRITSESPGTVSAVVTRDVWSADKACLAIPRGTRFVGRYQTQVAEGQARLGVIWTGLTRPPPRNDTIDLDDTVAGDPDGTAGLSGEVNGFFWRKLGYVAAASLLDIGRTSIQATGEGGMGAAIAGIFANRATSPIDEWARRQLDIPPVIQVPPREISIVLARHVPMDEFRTGR
ncbi:TrbI/VirB10 family protein (plasmid) [Skermanella sp. TT6]|uniref:TrbI/VirB10 family protein n=1 Tax=Skermanella cutis TaxID=2775420 RepID=A0ABX7BJS8_9PROT|nr:TrbI/VirB10 family protein [Skermanella sp. TT6]QQP93966.1 TrbI/VirB10 family protein [Skermanella sp. TT6]